MYLYAALLIPLLFAVGLLIFYRQRTKWWEYLLLFALSFTVVGVAKLSVESYLVWDTETWGGWITEARYYEDWNEYIHQMCSYTTCSGSGNNQSCTTHTYDCSYVRYHPEYWEVWDSNGEEHAVDKSWYTYFIKFFAQKPKFVEMHHPYYTDDGDAYTVSWPGTPETIESVATFHPYENRVQASHSVFNFEKFSPKQVQELGLFEEPEKKLFKYPAILGDCGAETKTDNERLRYFNAVMGKRKQLHMRLLCFHNQPLSTGHAQEAYWIGGNMNEVVVTVGLGPDNQVLWVHPFSWSDQKAPLIEIRNQLTTPGAFNATLAVELMAQQLESYTRKDFAKDFSYLTVEPPTSALIVVYILVILINGGVAGWIVYNDFSEGPQHYYGGYVPHGYEPAHQYHVPSSRRNSRFHRSRR